MNGAAHKRAAPVAWAVIALVLAVVVGVSCGPGRTGPAGGGLLPGGRPPRAEPAPPVAEEMPPSPTAEPGTPGGPRETPAGPGSPTGADAPDAGRTQTGPRVAGRGLGASGSPEDTLSGRGVTPLPAVPPSAPPSVPPTEPARPGAAVTPGDPGRFDPTGADSLGAGPPFPDSLRASLPSADSLGAGSPDSPTLGETDSLALGRPIADSLQAGVPAAPSREDSIAARMREWARRIPAAPDSVGRTSLETLPFAASAAEVAADTARMFTPSWFGDGPTTWRPGWVLGRLPEMMPSRNSLFYERARRDVSIRTLWRENLLKPDQQIREDTLRTALISDSIRTAELETSMGIRLPAVRWSRIQNDRVQQQVAVDQEAGTVEITRTLGDAPVEPPVRLGRGEYLRRLTAQSFHRAWRSELARGLEANANIASKRGMVNVDLPFELPSQLQGVFGEGKPNLSVRGSERISFGGTSRWRPKAQTTEYQRGQSKFPQLDMKQELNLQLTGTIGDKVSVDVDQSSQTITPLSNRIKIKYQGYEDEIVQRVDLGNTSLSLPGTEYVSYGGRAEGLFGINAQAKLGDMDITTILTKQEGKSDSKSVTRTAEVRTVKIEDSEYVDGKYFFLRNPDGCLWELDPGSLDVFIDDRNGSNDRDMGAVEGTATPRGTAESDTLYRGTFHRLVPGEPPDGEYQIQADLYTGHPVLILARPLGDQEALAVTYAGWNWDAQLERADPFSVGDVTGDVLRLKMLRPSSSDASAHPTNRTRGVWGPLANLELRNIYDLGARNILGEGFDLKIRRRGTDGDVVDPDRYQGLTFLQLLGIDLSEDTDTREQPGRDDRIDQQFISYQNGLLHFPDLRPFDPDSIDLGLESIGCGGYSYFRFLPWGQGDAIHAPRPGALPGPETGEPGLSSSFRAPAIYDSLTSQNRQADSRYYLEVTYRSPVSRIQLNAFNLLPGSEVVTAGARTLVRDRDYRIDYDIGEVEILDAANVTESEQINVNYSYLPFAGGGSQKTLAGIAGFYRPEQSQWAVSSSWLFESKGGVPGLEGRRPRLGQEPSRTVVGEFAGTYKSESRTLTRLLDALPGVNARADSRLEMGAGVGVSLPNPNTRDKLYIDDFDGVKDVMSLSMNRRLWRPIGIPVSPILPGSDLAREERDSLRAQVHGEMWWYSPRNAAHERDRQPTLEPREGDDTFQVLRMRLFPRGDTPEEREVSWAGVVQPLSTRGIDLSRAQFLDVWVNDFRQYRENPAPGEERRGKLVIDFGTVTEDALWYRNDPGQPQDQWRTVPPNGVLDTEDQITPDDLLDQGTQGNEDIGLDFAPDGSPEDDPFDNYFYDEALDENDPRKYAGVNGTEGNQELDTEDLNGNNQLDRLSSYFQIEIDLADSTLWETDVFRDYYLRSSSPPAAVLDPYNGWRRIRIPLGTDSLVRKLRDFEAADPAWEKIFHCRVWLTGFEEEAVVELGGVEITGNRWFEGGIADLRDRPLDETELAPGEQFFVGVLNNKDDAAIYYPPITTRKENDITEREQSITLNMRNFQPGHQASIYRTYSSAQDYTLYENMEFYLNRRFESADGAQLELAIRLARDAASDTTNYYEYRRPVPSDWDLVRIDFAELSRLQLPGAGEVDSTRGITWLELADGAVISRRGNPTLTAVQRITFLVQNRGDTPLGDGNVWVDELRLTQVKKDTGVAARFSVAADFSDLARVNFNFQRVGADFLRIGQDRGRGTTTTAWNVGASSENLFGFSNYLGIQAPLRTSFSFSRAVPKFRTNSDLVLDTATDRDITESRSNELSLSLSRRGSQALWERLLIAPFTVSGSYRRSINLQPSSRDTTVSKTGTVGWNLALQEWGTMTLRENWRTKLRLLPTHFGATLAAGNTETRRYSRTDLNSPYQEQPRQDRTTAGLSLTSGLQPITPLTYRVDSTRDLMLRDNQMQLGGINLGRETSRKHSLSASWDLPLLRSVLAPRVSWNGNSNLTLAAQNTAPAEGEPDRLNNYGNGRQTSFSGRFSPSELYSAIRAIGREDPDSAGARQPTGIRRPGSGLGISVGTIDVTYSVNRNTSFSRRQGEPTLLYQLGLSDTPGSGTSELTRATGRIADSNTLTMRGNIRFPRSVSLTTSFSRTNNDSRDNGLATNSWTRKWPELDVNWGQLHQLLGIGKLFTSFSANTRYSREERQQGTPQAPREQAGISESFSPLLNISATFRNGISATVTSSRRNSRDERFRPSLSVSERQDQQIGLTLKKTLNLRRQIRVPMTTETRTIQTRLDLNAGFDLSSQKLETQLGSAPPTVSSHRSSWKMTAGGAYQFTQSITGSGSVNFGQDADKKNEAQTANFIGITLTASFTF